MDRLWSPWRSEPLARAIDAHRPAAGSPADADGARTVFERIGAADPADDADNLVVWRGPHTFAVLNLYPYNNGHLLLVPYRAVADWEALRPEEEAELTGGIRRAIGWLRRAFRPDGFNVGVNLGVAGGAGVPDHLHVHVLPRWAADTNFMPTAADLKVIPQALRDSYDAVRRAVEAEG